MADLRVEQQTLTRGESVFSGAANRLGPVALAMHALDADAAGAPVLASALSAGDEGLAAGLQICRHVPGRAGPFPRRRGYRLR